ncbi:MAG TPA: OsmC family protein, partial [Haliangiales bacterium]|nr:OsmC family protein [Haliangiales bacterium]
AAVAASFDATIREIARERSIAIGRLAVIVTGDVDVRGARGERGVMVGFQSMRVEVQLRLGPDDTDSLIAAAEGRCVMLQTLRGALPIELVSGMGD